jgi:hypothetical protein
MGRVARTLVGVVALATPALAGCWPQPGANADQTGHNPFETAITPATVGALSEAWRTSVGAPSSVSLTQPVATASRVFVSVGPCGVAALRARDGASLWEATPESRPCFDVDPSFGVYTDWTPPYVQGDRVGYGYRAEIPFNPRVPELRAETAWFDVATGATRGGSPGEIPSGVRGDQVISAATRVLTLPPPNPPIVTGSQPNAFIRTSSTSGGPTTSVTSAGGQLPLLGRDAIFQVGTAAGTTPGDNTLTTGLRAYTLDEPHDLCGLVTCASWVLPITGGATAPILSPDQSTLYLGLGEALTAVDATSGAVRWTAPLGSAPVAPPALAGGTLFVPLADGRLVALDGDGCGAATCGVQWSATPGPGQAQPSVGGDVVFTVGQVDGSVEAFDAGGCGAATCAPLWTADVGDSITGSPAVAAGWLFVSTNLDVVAYALP